MSEPEPRTVANWPPSLLKTPALIVAVLPATILPPLRTATVVCVKSSLPMLLMAPMLSSCWVTPSARFLPAVMVALALFSKVFAAIARSPLPAIWPPFSIAS